jgi:acetylornithine aminotransferase
VLLNVVHDSVLRFVPPLIVTKQEINRMIAILDGIFAEVEL